MRVRIYPGTIHEEVKDLASALTPDDYYMDFANSRDVERYLRDLGEKFGQLSALLVEKGAIDLHDCMAFGAPYMEKEEDE